MRIIYKMTDDATHEDILSLKVKNFNEKDIISVVQTLTEYGLCYVTNSYIALNVSSRWIFLLI